MRVTGSLLELMVADVTASVNFYVDVLDFEVIAEEFEAGKRYWALAELDGFKISFKEQKRLLKEVPFLKEKPLGGTAVICFQVDDLEGYYNLVKSRCALLDHPHITPCGARAFSMLDNSSYVITIERFE